MSKLYLADPSGYDVKMNEIARHFSHKVEVYPPGSCPITMQISMLRTAANQTCGKCVPCRDGLPLVARLMQKVLDGRATEKTLDNIRMMATMIRSSADCAIGWNAADEVLKGLDLFADEYQSHIENKKCLESIGQKVPCISLCPAHVNIPGYIALVGEEDYAGAINLIRKDNPFPTACAMVCEHPCEERCRRKMLESPINIRALKKYAVDMMPVDKVATPKPNPSTGKSIGVIGGGPAGLTAAYFLALMGHKIEVYETHDKLGGMLRYGIPNYRFPKDRLDEDIRAILNSGDIHVTYNTTIGKDIPVKDIYEKHDAIFVGIGAQTGKTLRIEGAGAGNVVSAVDILDQIGNGNLPDYTGKSVVVIGGGNVAMDVARSSIRLGASKVSIVYRRRKADMTALEEEVEGAEAEGCDVLELMSPVRIKQDEEGNAIGLIVKPQMISRVSHGRPAPKAAAKDEVLLESDLIVVAIGQGIETKSFEEHGIKVQRGVISALNTGNITPQDGEMSEGVFAGGDCVTGPATVIKAIAAGKVAAANIDEYLGFNHEITCDVEIPYASNEDKVACGRVEVALRDAAERKNDFEPIEYGFSCEEACQEAGRCLRCDHFGFGAFRGGREEQW